ncbi:MAG: S41 family peptidase [Bacteroidota bacterium]
MKLVFYLLAFLLITACHSKLPTEASIKKAGMLSTVNDNRPEPPTVASGNMLRKDSLLVDLQILEQALTEMHPGLYRYNKPEDIRQSFQQLKEGLPAEISEGEFMTRLAQCIAKIRCGHTYLNPWNMNRELRERLLGGKTYFPVGFNIIEGHFFATENVSGNESLKRGAEILSINGLPIIDIYNRLKSIAKSDGHNFAPTDHYLSLQQYEFATWQAFDIYFQLFFPLQKEEYSLTFKNYDAEQVQRITVPALGKKERAEKMQAKYGEAILGKEDWSLEIVNSKLAVMRLGTFAIWKWKGFDQKQWFADAFHQLDSLGIEQLAIDIRGNGGGLAEPANELISYLIKDTLKCDDIGKIFIRTTKFNPDHLPYIDTWVDVLKTGLPPNLYRPADNDLYELLLPSDCQDLAPKAKGFEGQTYLFGDASNVSATYTLLKKAKQFGFATFIGQTSGGNQQGINGGEYAFFTVPYSKMEVDIPLKYFAPSQPMKDEGVFPQIPIEVKPENIAKEIDPYLTYLQKEAK